MADMTGIIVMTKMPSYKDLAVMTEIANDQDLASMTEIKRLLARTKARKEMKMSETFRNENRTLMSKGEARE